MESAKCSHRSGIAVLAVLMSRRVVGVLLLGTVGTYKLKAYLAAHQTAHQRAVGVAINTVVTAGTENTVEQGSSSLRR